MDFLQHEMVISAFFCGDGIPIDRNHFPRNKIPLNGHQFDSVFGQYSHFPVIQNIHIPRIVQNCRDIGTDKVLPFAQTDDQRARLTYGYQFTRLVLR
ncbi:hypothetical protein D1872_303690 [compost metagenome]